MDVALELRGAGRVGAIADGFPFGSVSRRAANRATLRHDEFPFVSVAPLGDNLHHLGITSPARWTTTVSPMRMSLRRISSSWSVARLTITPPMLTGSSMASGVKAPVRPTLTTMSLMRVVC